MGQSQWLASIGDEISAHTMPDADAIKSKMNHAIARLRTETDPHELFELRATINASLRDSVKLIFGGHPDSEVAVGFSVIGEPVQPLVFGNRSLEITSTVASLKEAKRVVDGLGSQMTTYQRELEIAFDEMGKLLGVKDNADGTYKTTENRMEIFMI